MIHDWAKILDNQGQVDTFISDFEKAFDTPPHELLKTTESVVNIEVDRCFSVLQTTESCRKTC